MGVTTAVVVTGGVLASAAAAWSVLWWYEGEKCEKPKFSVKTVLAGRPKFSVRNFNVMEVREYEPYVIAQATVSGPMRKSMSGGFMKVARYIFGDNTKKGVEGEQKEKVAMTAPVIMQGMPEKIAMTSPVQMQADSTSEEGNGTSDSTYKISFVMPSQYTLSTLPVPKDTELELKEVPGHTLAAYSYFGASPSEARVAQVASILKARVERSAARQRCGCDWLLRFYTVMDVVPLKASIVALVEEGMKCTGTPLLYQYHPPFAPAFLRRVEVLYAVE